MRKELKAIVTALHEQGFDTKVTANGRTAVTLRGEYVAVFARNPKDAHADRNEIAKCRRHGFIWPR